MSTEKRIKEEKSELKDTLESMEEKDCSREVNICVMPNLHTEISRTAQDEQPPFEPLEEVPAGEFNESMMDNVYIINFYLKKAFTFTKSPSIPLPRCAVILKQKSWCRRI